MPRRSNKNNKYRSKFEKNVAKALEVQGARFGYETQKIGYTKPAQGSVYTPDFILENGIIIETKGRFTLADRQKHILIRNQHPELDIRFVFMNPRVKINKGSRTTYACWCEKHGFRYASGSVPEAWVNEVITTDHLC